MSAEDQRDQEFMNQRENQLPYDPRERPVGVTDNSAMDALHRAPPGEPAIDYSVRSIYDSRPVNGFDFNFTDSAGQELAAVNDFDFTVPVGYVAVLRSIIHTISNPGGINRGDTLLTIRINGADVQYNQSFPVGSETDGTFPQYFVIADEGDVIRAHFVNSVVAGTSVIFCTFHGNFLRKTGRPKQFEIANPIDQRAKGALTSPVSMSNTPTLAPPMGQTFAPSPVPSEPHPNAAPARPVQARRMSTEEQLALIRRMKV